MDGAIEAAPGVFASSELPCVELESAAEEESSGEGSCAGANDSGMATNSGETSAGLRDGALDGGTKNRIPDEVPGDVPCFTGGGKLEGSASTFSSSYCAVAMPAVTVMKASQGPSTPTVGVIDARPF